MDTRHAFLNTARTIFQASTELSCYRIVGNTAKIAVLSVQADNPDLYKTNKTPAIEALKKITPKEYHSFDLIFSESSIIIAYSWLDSFLSELEEALFLHDPKSLGESVQIKLGKVLSSDSLADLIHDIARRRTREKGNWGLKGRIGDLRTNHGIDINASDKHLEWLSDVRNNIVHNRRVGQYFASKKKVGYKRSEREGSDNSTAQQALSITFNLLADLYIAGAKSLGITRKFPQHRTNQKFVESLRTTFLLPAP